MAADDFGGLGPGQEANEGFKMFGLSTNKFALAVATADFAINKLSKTIDAQARQSRAQVKEERDISKMQEEAAEMQLDAAEINEDVAKKAQSRALTETKVMSKWQKISSVFNRAVENFSSGAKDIWGKGISGFKDVIGELGSTIKDFAGRFVVIFTAVNILSRILTNLMDTRNLGSSLRRSLGPQFADNFARQDGFATQVTRLTQGRVDPQVAAEIAVSLNKTLKDVSRITPNIVADIADIAEGLNIDASTAATFFGEAMFATDATATQIKQSFANIALIAKEAGLSADDLASSLMETPVIAQQWVMATRQGQLELGRAAAKARQLGSDLVAIRTTADKFFDLSAAAEEAAKLQALGLQGFSATRIVSGALTDPTKLISDILRQTRNQFGELNPALGMDRVKLDAILTQSSALSDLFDREALAKALRVVDKSDELDAIIAARTALVADAGRFEENALTHLQDLVVNGQTIETRLENIATNIASKIADVIRPAFNQLYNAVIDLVNVLDRLIPGFGRKSSAQATQEAIMTDAGTALTTTIRDQLTNRTGIASDDTVTSGEISKLVVDRISAMRSIGLNVSSEEQHKLMSAIRDWLQFQKDTSSKPVKVIISDMNGRTMMNGMTGGAFKQ